MSLWQKIKYAFTRRFRNPFPDPPVYVRWYSKQSCQWSKWRTIEGMHLFNSDPELMNVLSHGQKVEVTRTLPDGARVHKRVVHPHDRA